MRLFSSVIAVVLLVGNLTAAPPGFNPPETIPVTSGIAIYNPPADCVSVKYIGLDGEEEFPLELVGGSKTAFAFFTRGLPVGKKYRFVGVASSATGEQVEKQFAVVIPGGQPPPVDPPVDPVDPVDPPVDPPTKNLYFLVVRPDGPAHPDFTKVMSMPEWVTLRTAGHTVGVATAKQAAALNITVPANLTHAVVTLRVSADGKRSTVVREAIQLPTTADAILKLPEVK